METKSKLFIMKQRMFLIVCACLFVASVSATNSTSQPTSPSATEVSQSNVFPVTGYYVRNGQYYKCRLKLQLVQSSWGSNSYIAIEYATEYYNGQWYWHRCNASCRYDAVNRQHYVQIGYDTIYFDDPLE